MLRQTGITKTEMVTNRWQKIKTRKPS